MTESNDEQRNKNRSLAQRATRVPEAASSGHAVLRKLPTKLPVKPVINKPAVADPDSFFPEDPALSQTDPARISEVIPPKESKASVAAGFGSHPPKAPLKTVKEGGEKGFKRFNTPEQLAIEITSVGYQCLPFVASQVTLLLSSPIDRVRSLLLEGPSGCGKSFFAKSLAKITGAEFMCISCYKNMPLGNLIESPSTLAMVNAMAGKADMDPSKLLNLGPISRAFHASNAGPVIMLIDELDKAEDAIDTFFLGPLQDGKIWLESRPPIDANLDNLLFIFTKNFNRKIDDALLRRTHPIKMTYLDSTLERKILEPHCDAKLVANLVAVADRMRFTNGSYQFERPPAPEELLTAGHYIQNLLKWNSASFSFVGKSVWAIIAKSEHDRAVLEHMLRYHPDFLDPLVPDGKNAAIEEVHKKLGRLLLQGIVADPDDQRRERAWKEMEYS